MRNRLDLSPIWSVEAEVIPSVVLRVSAATLCADTVGGIWLHDSLQLLLHVPTVQKEHVHPYRHVVLTLVKQTLTTACVCRSARSAASGSASRVSTLAWVRILVSNPPRNLDRLRELGVAIIASANLSPEVHPLPIWKRGRLARCCERLKVVVLHWYRLHDISSTLASLPTDQTVGRASDDQSPDVSDPVAREVHFKLRVPITTIFEAQGLKFVVSCCQSCWRELHVAPRVARRVLRTIDPNKRS